MPFFGITPWHPFLPIFIAIPVIPAALLGLAYLNFKHFHENWRLWRRNLLGLTGALLFIIVSSAVIYNRVWEIFEPAELPHGPAKFSLVESAETAQYFARRSARPVARWPGLVRQLGFGFSRSIQLVERIVVVARPSFAEKRRTMAVHRRFELGFQRRREVELDRRATSPCTWLSGHGWRQVRRHALDFKRGQTRSVWTGAKMIRFGDETNWKEVVPRGQWFSAFEKRRHALAMGNQ